MIAGLSECVELDRTTPLASSEQSPPFRPIQYLGSKLRVLDQIADAAEDLLGRSGRALDLFSGTSVVSQCLAARGFAVTASDTQAYARIFASALLGVGREGEACPGEQIIACAKRFIDEPLFDGFRPLADEEGDLRRADKVDELMELYDRVPLAWRDPSHHAYSLVRHGDGAPAFERLPLISSMYAGSYFGVEQAGAIDAIRLAIHRLEQSGELTSWQVDAALSALMSATSSAVHSAGKHFAQPLTAGTRANKKFRAKRIMDDRAVAIDTAFLFACAAINKKAPTISCGHQALQMAAEEVAVGCKGDLLYLDPPYTAQQYSRFYHVLETLADYKVEGVLHNGSITTGIYPTNRYKSAFSSKRAAPKAFAHLLDAAKDQSASVLISYSQSEDGSDGNERMIGLDQLLLLCSERFGPRYVEIAEMGHKYRQFNSAGNSNSQRSDPEILIVCRAR
jgi:adenine-specific DNA methylase